MQLKTQIECELTGKAAAPLGSSSDDVTVCRECGDTLRQNGATPLRGLQTYLLLFVSKVYSIICIDTSC